MLSRFVKPLLYSILFGTAIYVISVLASGYEHLVTVSAQLGISGLALIFGLSLVNYGVRFIRWHWYVRRLGCDVSLMNNLAYYLAGFAFTTSPGKAGEAIRSLYLKAHNMSYTSSLAAFFTERLSDLLAMILLASLAAFSFNGYELFVIIPGVGAIVLLMMIQKQTASHTIERLFGRFFSRGRLSELGNRLISMLGYSSTLLKTKILLGGFFLSLLAWGAEGVAFYYIIDTLDLTSSLWLAIGIYALSELIGAISFIPGGLGSTEAVMGALLVVIGADVGDAVAATVIFRIATLWFAVIIGLLVMSLLEAKGINLADNNVNHKSS